MTITGDYAIIETAEEALACHVFTSWLHSGQRRATRAEVLAAITPKKDDALFWWNIFGAPNRTPEYSLKSTPIHKARLVKANALTIGKTVGELRELLAWASSANENNPRDIAESDDPAAESGPKSKEETK